jgi:peptidoglycan/xylan/chitin deacetylase (PgdA/CDA1 family)
VLAVFYHAVSEQPLPHVAPLYACKSPAQFEQDLIYLKQRYALVGHDDIVAARRGGKPLPARAASVTFDDGFAECYSVARPLLLKHGVPCTFFVIRDMVDNRALMYRNQVALCLSRLDRSGADAAADLDAVAAHCGRRFATKPALRRWVEGLGFGERATIDRLCGALAIDVDAYLRRSRPYMSAEEIRRLHAEGFAIGAHSLDHPPLGQLPWREAREQIVASWAHVRALTGRERVPFAFPFNGLDVPRHRLAGLREEAGIDLLYDTNNLMADRDFIVNRVWCDTPVGAARGASNLPRLVRRARVFEPLRAVKRWLTLRPAA